MGFLWFDSTFEFKACEANFLRLTTKSLILWGNIMISTPFISFGTPTANVLRLAAFFVVVWTFMGDVFAQTFTDGDAGGSLYTQHVGGYLGQGVSFADFNGDGNVI